MQCSFVVKPQYMLPIHHGPQVGRDFQDRVRDGLGWRHYFTQPDGSIPYIAKQQTAEAAAAAERDWQARACAIGPALSFRSHAASFLEILSARSLLYF